MRTSQARVYARPREIPRDVWETTCDQMGPVQNFVSRNILSATTLTPAAYRARNRYLTFRLSEKPRREPQEFTQGERKREREVCSKRRLASCVFIELRVGKLLRSIVALLETSLVTSR